MTTSPPPSYPLAFGLLLVLAQALTAGCQRASPAAAAGPGAQRSAQSRALTVLDRYGLARIEPQFSEAAIQARERSSPFPFEHALALAIEHVLTYREAPSSPASLALARAPESPCPSGSPVAALACFMNRGGAVIALAEPATPPDMNAPDDAHFMFVLTIPALADAPYWVVVGTVEGGDAVASSFPAHRPVPRKRLGAADSECSSTRRC